MTFSTPMNEFGKQLNYHRSLSIDISLPVKFMINLNLLRHKLNDVFALGCHGCDMLLPTHSSHFDF